MRGATTTERGYGIEHQRLRALLAPQVAAGAVACWRCRRLIDPDAPWHLGHDDVDRSIYRGPEHVRCNLATMQRGRATARARRSVRKPRRQRSWLSTDQP